MSLTPLAARYEQFILDLDGCVWIGDEPTEGAVDAVAALRDAGKRVAFATTNDPRGATEDYVARLWRLGLKASLRDVVTVGGAVQHLLAETCSGRTAFVVGTASMRRHVSHAGLKVLNGTDLASRAASWPSPGPTTSCSTTYVRRRSPSTAGRPARHGPRPDLSPAGGSLGSGTGAILAAVEYATGRRAAIVGKPEPQLFLTALDRLGKGSTLVIGDCADADLAAAARAELDAALVLTGDRGSRPGRWGDAEACRGGPDTRRPHPPLRPAPSSSRSTPTRAQRGCDLRGGPAAAARASLRRASRRGRREGGAAQSAATKSVWRSPWTATAPRGRSSRRSRARSLGAPRHPSPGESTGT